MRLGLLLGRRAARVWRPASGDGLLRTHRRLNLHLQVRLWHVALDAIATRVDPARAVIEQHFDNGALRWVTNAAVVGQASMENGVVVVERGKRRKQKGWVMSTGCRKCTPFYFSLPSPISFFLHLPRARPVRCHSSRQTRTAFSHVQWQRPGRQPPPGPAHAPPQAPRRPRWRPPEPDCDRRQSRRHRKSRRRSCRRHRPRQWPRWWCHRLTLGLTPRWCRRTRRAVVAPSRTGHEDEGGGGRKKAGK